MTIIHKIFTEDNKLQPIIIKWLHEAMCFDLNIIQNSRFVKADSLRYHAQTFYKTVWYQNPEIKTNSTHHYKISDWLNLIAHEIQHRQDIGDNLFSGLKFGISYSYHWMKNLAKGKNAYYNNPHEIRAFEMGCNNDSKVNVWLRNNPEFLTSF